MSDLPCLISYLSPVVVAGLCKAAEAKKEEPKPDWAKRSRIVGAGLLGVGLGTASGYLAGKLVNHIQPISSPHLQIAAPLLGGAAGLAYSLYKAREMEELKRAVKPSPDDESAISLPGG